MEPDKEKLNRSTVRRAVQHDVPDSKDKKKPAAKDSSGTKGVRHG